MRYLVPGLLLIFMIGCTATPKVHYAVNNLIGAWADGTEAGSCSINQITYFSSDAVVIDLYSTKGLFHSFGKWRIESDQIVITHNEFPLLANGQSGPEIALTIVRLDKNQLDIKNTKGELRKRVKCHGLTLSVDSQQLKTQ